MDLQGKCEDAYNGSSDALTNLSLSLTSMPIWWLSILIYFLAEDEEEEDVHLVPGSADDAPRTTSQVQGSSGEITPASSRPSGRVIGVIKRNWHS